MISSKCPVADKIPLAPYIKPKNFLSNLIPIVLVGIPAYADSTKDKAVIGTPEYEEFWENELRKIMNGFWIGEIWIPGRFYWYMNYKLMSTIDGAIVPDFVDMHLELAYHIEHCLANGKNLLIVKGRRKGISEALSTMVVDYGWRFGDGFKAGVVAGQKVYVEGFLEKWRFSDSRLPPEFSTKALVNNDNEIIAGYQIKNQHGAYEEKGTFNAIYCRTAGANPNVFKGLYLNVVISEELGEHEDWIPFFNATKDCLRSGNQQRGILIALGTVGNLNKGSKDLKDVWYKPKSFNFVRMMISADRFNIYGGAKDPAKRLTTDSVLRQKYSDYQLVGFEDREVSLKHILDNRKILLEGGNMLAYYEDLQNNPVTEQDMFRKNIINKFNITKLNEQQIRIDNLSHPKWTKYRMDWVVDERGMIVMPLQVKIRPLALTDPQDEFISILDGELPRKGHMNLVTAGADSYDQDEAKESKSLGAMLIRIRNNNIIGAMRNAPIACICCRPRRKEIFYDMCLKASVLYNIVGNVLVDVGAGLVMQYFKDNGGWKYLADRPKKFESETSQQTHEKGVRFTTFSRPRMISLMQTDIEDNSDQYWFGESADANGGKIDLINQLTNYDEEEIGSDNDLADALGLSIMQDVSCEVRHVNQEEDHIHDRFSLPQFKDGQLVQKGADIKVIQQDHELFGMMFGKLP